VIVDAAPSAMPMSAMRGSVLMIPEDGVMLNPAPLYHNFPFAMTHMSMLNGCSVVGMSKFDPERLLWLIDRYRVEWVNLVPTMMNRVARLPAEVRSRYDLSSLKTLWHTAAPIPPGSRNSGSTGSDPSESGDVRRHEGFATTQLNGAEWLAHRGSVGRSQSEIQIRGENGALLTPGEVGEIYMRGRGGQTDLRIPRARQPPDGDGSSPSRLRLGRRRWLLVHRRSAH
jgi:bile acid-coenzyme A ligase